MITFIALPLACKPQNVGIRTRPDGRTNVQQLQAHSRNRGATNSAKLWVVLEELCSLKIVFISKDSEEIGN